MPGIPIFVEPIRSELSKEEQVDKIFEFFLQFLADKHIDEEFYMYIYNNTTDNDDFECWDDMTQEDIDYVDSYFKDHIRNNFPAHDILDRCFTWDNMPTSVGDHMSDYNQEYYNLLDDFISTGYGMDCAPKRKVNYKNNDIWI